MQNEKNTKEKTPEGVYDNENNLEDFAITFTFSDGKTLNFETYKKANEWLEEKITIIK